MNTKSRSLTRSRIFPFLLSMALIVGFSATGLQAQSSTVRKQLADLSQRFNELERKYSLLQLEVQNLTAENNRLKKQMAEIKSAAPKEEMGEAVEAKLDRHRKDTESYVKEQYDKILSLLSSKIDNVSKAEVSTHKPKTEVTSQKVSFSGDFPKNGVVYTVKSGDTLSKIAQEFGSKIQYIQNANQITDPNNVQIGQKLFVPVEE